MTSERTVPHDPQAEASALGAAMLSGRALEVLVTETTPSDFYTVKHQMIAATLGELWAAGIISTDPVIIADEMRANGTLEHIGGPEALITLQSATPATSSIGRYCRIILEHATHRRLIAVGTEIAAMGYGAPDDVAATVDTAKALVANVEMPIGEGAPSANLDEFLDAGGDEYDWLVPGLLEVGDRLIVTGGEGFGKSTLLRQMAVQVASGIHPFTGRPITARTVYVVDLENTATQSRRKYRSLRAVAGRHLHPQNLRIDVRTEGLDLQSRADRQWLVERVASNRPELLVIGPIYKMHLDEGNSETAARTIAGVIDFLRGKFGITTLMEAHSPHMSPNATKRNLRPIGSSVWLRWPEFGYGLAPTTDPLLAHVEGWRGPRDAREWPTTLRRSGRSDQWPWVDNHLAAREYGEEL